MTQTLNQCRLAGPLPLLVTLRDIVKMHKHRKVGEPKVSLDIFGNVILAFIVVTRVLKEL